MRTLPLGDLVEILGGGTPDRSVAAYWGGRIPWASVKDFKSTELARTDEHITDLGVEKSATNVIPAGSIIVPTRMAVGKAAINTVDLAINQDLKALRPSKGVDARYLLHMLLAQSSRFEMQAKGATVKGITLDVLRGAPIPLPQLDEQRRIAAILDQADSLRQKRALALGKLECLPSLWFRELFGDPVHNEDAWRRGAISDLVLGFETGKNLVAADDEDSSSGYRVLKISAVTSLNFAPQESKALPTDYTPPDHHLVQQGDLLFSRANTSELIGATALVDCECERLALPDKLWRFRWHEDQRTEPMFVWQLFMDATFREQVRRRATGTSGSMKNISQDKVLGIEVGIPPLALQREFASRFSEVRTAATSMRQQAKAFDQLFASLQHRAFNGELTAKAVQRELAGAG